MSSARVHRRHLGPAAILCCAAGLAAGGIGVADAARAGAARRAPAPWSVIRNAMHRTFELGPGADERFGSISRRVVVGDGRGGSLTAVIGVRMPTADGKGQLVFLFHNRAFIGWDSNRESPAIAGLRGAGTRRFSVRYVHYARHDALCCPSRRPVTVRYRWTGRRIVASGRPPNLGTHVGYRR